MSNRIIKESINSSESLSKCSIGANLLFDRLTTQADDHGCFDARVKIIRGKVFPLMMDKVSEEDIDEWLSQLTSVDGIRLWVEENGVRYGIFPNFGDHQRIRSLHQRKTPIPPKEITSNKSILADSCRQVSADDGLNPNPNPNPNPKKKSKIESPTSRFSFSDEDLKTANWMFKKVQFLLPNVKKPVFESWANDIRLIREVEKKTDSEIRTLFEWANNHHFWWKQIRCPGKLRIKWEDLEAQSTDPVGHGTRSTKGPSAEEKKGIIKNQLIRIKDSKFQGPENWPHEIRQFLIKVERFEKDHREAPLDPQEIEFLKTALAKLEGALKNV